MGAEGVARRAEIDAETVRGLQLINGGSAAALTAMLPNILTMQGFRGLAIAMGVAIVLNTLGLACAVVHNRLRRKCSLEYDKPVESRARPYKSRLVTWCKSVPNEPAICTRSVIFMWASLLLFLLGVGAVMTGAARVLSVDAGPSPPECWEVREIGAMLVRVDKCTGDVHPVTMR